MAEITETDNHKRGRNRAKKVNVRVDLTPMVDLAFLLITFFMLTTTLMEQRAIRVRQPDTTGAPASVSECQLIYLLADSGSAYYTWEGLECHSVTPIALRGSNSIARKLTDKKAYLATHCLYPSGGSKEVLCIIKLLPGSRYEQMVALIDEMQHDSIATYTIQDYTADELRAVRTERTRLALH
ncbi:MAG: biopolymer transporter ExbD [Bacteroidetes bacterium]|nr:biopolymer transporter ExbD [Bacteroidota bacterium]